MNEIDHQSSDGSSNENSSNRRSQRRRINVQTSMRSSSLTTTIFNENLSSSSIFDTTKENDFQEKERRSTTKLDEQFVFSSSNENCKSPFWTVTDRHADWYKLTAPHSPSISNSSIGESKILEKIFHRTKINFNSQNVDQINDATQLIMKVIMRELDYDLDEEDLRFLVQLNKIRPINEDQLENGIVILEYFTAEQIRLQLKQKSCEDENIVCDVCLLTDGDDGNEMVFCERCNACVHQNCYGISTVPTGTWLCKPCSIVRRPACLLCPKVAGPMKCTSSGTIWCHLTCALWLPELKFSDYVRMEPILNLNQIPHARWTLRCVVCSSSDGACVQCAQKNCRTPFHVTCGLSAGYFLDVQQTSTDENRNGRSQFNVYCLKHSEEARQRADPSDSKDSPTIPLTVYRRQQLKTDKWIKELNERFFEFVSPFHLHDQCPEEYDKTISNEIFQYWKLKREKNLNSPLICRIDFVLEQRETAELLLSQINNCLKIREKLVKLENLSKFVVSKMSSNKFLNQRLENLKSKLKNRRLDRFRTLIENSKNFIVGLETNFREGLELNTTYLISQTLNGEMLIVPKKVLEENSTKIDDQPEFVQDEEEKNSPKFVDKKFEMNNVRYACYGNLVTCVTGSFD